MCVSLSQGGERESSGCWTSKGEKSLKTLNSAKSYYFESVHTYIYRLTFCRNVWSRSPVLSPLLQQGLLQYPPLHLKSLWGHLQARARLTPRWYCPPRWAPLSHSSRARTSSSRLPHGSSRVKAHKVRCECTSSTRSSGAVSFYSVVVKAFRSNVDLTVLYSLFALLGLGTETTVATTSGHTFQITGTSVGGKVVTTKLPLPANSKIVTVNVPTSQGGKQGFNVTTQSVLTFRLSIHYHC